MSEKGFLQDIGALAGAAALGDGVALDAEQAATVQKKVYVLDGNVPILVRRTTMEETLDVEAKNHVEMFHHYFFTLAPDDKYIRYTMEKAMYLVDETGLAQYNTLKEKGSAPQYKSDGFQANDWHNQAAVPNHDFPI